MDKSLAFLQGYYAYHEHLNIFDNPYPPSEQSDRQEWNDGFLKAGEYVLMW